MIQLSNSVGLWLWGPLSVRTKAESGGGFVPSTFERLSDDFEIFLKIDCAFQRILESSKGVYCAMGVTTHDF